MLLNIFVNESLNFLYFYFTMLVVILNKRISKLYYISDTCIKYEIFFTTKNIPI